MADFADARNDVMKARSERERAEADLYAAVEQARKLDAEIARLERVAGKGAEGSDRLAEALKRREEAEKAVKERGRALDGARERERGAVDGFAPLTDPSKLLEALDDATPFLLFPLRVETRFKTSAADGKPQLWVRVYPDDCLIDTFEELLSEAEVANARLFWIDWWRAGRKESQRRAAWRALVASHGAGRAAYIVQRYRPVNPHEEPAKADDADIILTIPAEEALSPAAATAAAAYWRAAWRAASRAELSAAEQALTAAVGASDARTIIERYAPRNLGEAPAPPRTRASVSVSVAFVIFPAADATATKQRSWTRAPRVRLLPDRLMLLAYEGDVEVVRMLGELIPQPLVCGLDPSAPAEDQLRPDGGDLAIPEDMRWMVDFERAVASGLGFKVDLTDAQARKGFDRLLVLGARLSADEDASRALLEELIGHHQHSGRGVAILPHGTPTNNTEGASAGHARGDDADGSYDDLFVRGELFEEVEDPLDKRDGQRLAELLGIDPARLKKVAGSGGADQIEGRAMNVALWPATLGYFLQTMMHPVVDEADVDDTRWFFTRFVSGRGALPALRIQRQPYGVLPTTAFSRLRPIKASRGDDERRARYLERLHALLRRVDADWTARVADVSRVGKPGDPHQILLDVVGLHPSSVEYHQRYAESLDHLFNVLHLRGLGGVLVAALIAAGYLKRGTELLSSLGYGGADVPDILNRFFFTSQNLLRGPVVDDRPLSEREPIRPTTRDGQNYVRWLIEAARKSLEVLRRQEGFADDRAPTALLYLYLRHALMLGYWDRSLRLRRDAAVLTPAQVKAARRERAFVHVSGGPSESRFDPLYTAELAVTGDPKITVAEFIAGALGSARTPELNEQLAALERLADAPTARLERAFAEHIDCCSYRFDAWMLGLVHHRLSRMRFPDEKEGKEARRGIHLGAYGWLEDVRPEGKKLEPVALPGELDGIFNKNPAEAPLMRDPTNGGHVLTPSLNHAVTAAVLRNGYLSNATPESPSSLAVNLSSGRVRRALSFLEGLRGGQSLGALLGYQLERGLHDRHAVAEVDAFIAALRKEFPLRANRIQPTRVDDADVAVERIEARNVVDGLRLLEHVRATGAASYPFGRPLPPASPAQASAIDAEVQGLLDIHDAIADLGLAESVHQAVQGNFDRAAGTLDTFAKGSTPQEPDILRTPRTGRVLTHRVGLHLKVGVPSTASPVDGVAMTPRAKAEPAVNDWLAAVLPAPDAVACEVRLHDPASAATVARVVTQRDLGLQPIDLLHVLRLEDRQAMSELDDRILAHASAAFAPRPDARLEVRYAAPIDGRVTFFELAPLIRHLRALLLRSRPLRAGDVALGNEVRQADDATVSLPRARAELVQADLDALRAELVAFVGGLTPLLDDLPDRRADVLAAIDATFARAIELLERASRFGLPQTGWGFALEWRQARFAALIGKVTGLVERWGARLAGFDQLVAAYDALPGGATDDVTYDQKIALLRRAESEVSTLAIVPLPATPDDLKAAILAKRGAFAARRAAFAAVAALDTTSLSALLGAVAALLPVADVDREPFVLADVEDAVVAFTADVAARATALADASAGILAKVAADLAAHDAATTDAQRVERLTAALQRMLGDDFKVVPAFAVPAHQGDEWELALAASEGGPLLEHAASLHDFPVDDWLYGVARVRDKLRAWEQAVMLSGAFLGAEPSLVPLQLPYRSDDRWLGLEAPDSVAIDGDRLLYTAHYAAPFEKGAPQCGLLLDEWTEVIPTREETVGLTFHYDRPSCEAPQCLLLVAPPELTGAWRFDDLAAAVRETFDLAKKRAVEPTHIDATAYAQFAPATVMAAALHPITIATTIAVNNGVLAALADHE
ncbi:hypothetical protein AB3662_19735 [Sorangium cellulosum]|uniref:hypothetical protein n=1 Tax=Sorangium cellulosum TaxID=56 RepID=UPI003D9A3236